MSSTVVWSSQSALIAVISLTWLSSQWGWHYFYPDSKLTQNLRMVNSIIPVTVVFYHCHSKIKFHPLKATVQIPHVWEWRSSNETTTTAFQAFPVELLVFMDGSSRTSSTTQLLTLIPIMFISHHGFKAVPIHATVHQAMEPQWRQWKMCNVTQCQWHAQNQHMKKNSTNPNLYLTLNIQLRQPNAI